MIIDFVSKFIFSARKEASGQILYLYMADQTSLTSVLECFKEHGYSDVFRRKVSEDETEITCVCVDPSQNEVHAFRSITSHFELFYMLSQEQGLIITDHMRNMLSYLPVSQRKIDVRGVCDVCLFQHSYGSNTYLSGIKRLTYGEKLDYVSGELTVSIAQKLVINRFPELKDKDGAQCLAQTMTQAWEKMKHPDSINTLSGGVDSTLTHLVMGNPKSVSGSYEYEAFLHEKNYALQAAKLLKADHTVYDIELSDYMDLMAQVSRTYGMPPYNLTAQNMHYVIANHVTQSHIMCSELAGAVYGLELREPYTQEQAAKYPIRDYRNYANVNSSIARKEDVLYLQKLFGKEIVLEQMQKRNDYVLDRLENFDETDIQPDNYLMLGHLMYWFSNTGVGILEQTEMSYGKTMNALFSDKSLIENFLSLDIQKRYEDSIYGEKPWAKKLLEQWLPDYEVNKKKLGGSLPRTWMVTEGPMKNYFLEHEIPFFVPKELHDDMKHPGWESSWGVKYMIMFQIWYEEVFTKDLPKHPSSIYYELTK